MHASTEQLLSCRDGEPSAAHVKRHSRDCEQCRDALNRLAAQKRALVDLPDFAPPPGAWAAITGRVASAERARRSRRAMRLGAGAAIAASTVMAVLLLQGSPPVHDAPRVAHDTTTVRETLTTVPDVTGARDATAQLVARSRRLDALVKALEAHGPRVVDARTAGMIAGLEDGVAVVDYGLMHGGEAELTPAQSQLLWRRRVTLMNSLAQVRGAQLQRVDF